MKGHYIVKRVHLCNAFLTSSGHMDAFASVPFFGSMALILSRVLAFKCASAIRATNLVTFTPHAKTDDGIMSKTANVTM